MGIFKEQKLREFMNVQCTVFYFLNKKTCQMYQTLYENILEYQPAIWNYLIFLIFYLLKYAKKSIKLNISLLSIDTILQIEKSYHMHWIITSFS